MNEEGSEKQTAQTEADNLDVIITVQQVTEMRDQTSTYLQELLLSLCVSPEVQKIRHTRGTCCSRALSNAMCPSWNFAGTFAGGCKQW